MTERSDAGAPADGDDASELPSSVVDEAERLTRLAREASGDERDAYEHRREALLAGHDFAARVRTDDPGDVLVCYPAEWREDGTVRTDRIDDLSRAVEVPLAGPGDPDDWDAVEAQNRELVAAVREAHGDVHGDNAAALADFMGNHCARPIESATSAELAEFRTEYFVRNAWPSDAQRATIDESIERVFETAGEPLPGSGVQ